MQCYKNEISSYSLMMIIEQHIPGGFIDPGRESG